MISNRSIAEKKYYSFANFNIEIKFGEINPEKSAESSLKNNIKYYYRIFELKNPPGDIDYTIEFVQRYEYEVMVKTDQNKHFINFYIERAKKIITFYHISNLQFQLVIRRVIQKLLADNRGFLFHASSSLVNGRAYLFLGKSGSGKSTAVKLLSQAFLPLADDSVILRKENNKFYVYQTPVRDKNFWGYKNNQRHPMGKIFFLKKKPFYKIEKVKNKNLIAKSIMEQLFIESENTEKEIKFILEFVGKFNDFNYLYFSRNNPPKMIELIKDYEKV